MPTKPNRVRVARNLKKREAKKRLAEAQALIQPEDQDAADAYIAQAAAEIRSRWKDGVQGAHEIEIGTKRCGIRTAIP